MVREFGHFDDIAAHFQCSFIVPSAPLSLLERLRFLEDHIVHLEKEYPPWAALHFNQPNRGVSISDLSKIRHSNIRSLVASST